MLACNSKPSSLVISDEDRAMFDSILRRGGDEVHFFSASDGTSIACTVIRPKTDPVAVVAFIHGIAVASRLYTPMADSLAGQGYIVIMMDIRGHSLGTYIWMATLQSFSDLQVDGLILMSGGVVPQKRSKTPSGHKVGTFIRGHRLEYLLSFIFPGLKPIEIVLPKESQAENQPLVTRYSRRFFTVTSISAGILRTLL